MIAGAAITDRAVQISTMSGAIVGVSFMVSVLMLIVLKRGKQYYSS